MRALGRNQKTEADELYEYRISNKEFRMMKFNHLRFSPSAFFIRCSTFCGSLLHFFAICVEVTHPSPKMTNL